MPLQEWSKDITIAKVGDEPSFSEDMTGLLSRLEEGEPLAPSVIVDLGDVTYLNSSSLALLVRLRKRVKDTGGRLKLCAVRDSIWSLFLMTGLDRVFEFNDDVATSLASLQIGEV